MRIIPAIDIINGACVRLTQGDYNTKKVYNQSPLDVAKRFQDHGIAYLHLVDLDGAKSQRIVNYKTLELIATKTQLKVDFGGGIKSDEDIRLAFESGANQVSCGSVAVKNKSLFLNWLSQYGSQKIVLGADANNRKIATNGWLEQSEVEVINFIKAYQQAGIDYVVCTDIAKDGMLQGPSVELYQDILSQTSVKLIGSGGISSMKDLEQLIAIGCEGAIIGKAIYEGHITLKDLEKFVLLC